MRPAATIPVPVKAEQLPFPVSSPEAEKPEPRRDLTRDGKRGGHTLERHVGKTDADLAERLRREKRISAASTFTDRSTAERVIGAALAANKERIKDWTLKEGRRQNLVIEYAGSSGQVIGRSLRRGRNEAEPCRAAVVVLKWDEDSEVYYVLTSYPEARR
jgi:hypothetical protein